MKVFLPQVTLEEWVVDDKADVCEGTLVFSGQSAAFPVTPAVHFEAVLSGDDAAFLLLKVKTEEQVVALGGELMRDSVLLGETAYQVAPGYVTLLPDPRAVTGGDGTPASELLAAFLLDKLPPT